MNGNEPTLRDISVMLNPDTPEWPGDTPFTCGWASLISAGASVNVSSFSSSPHVGTHADAPIHVREGWSGSHELSLDAYFGPPLSWTFRVSAKRSRSRSSRKSSRCHLWSGFFFVPGARSPAVHFPRTGPHWPNPVFERCWAEAFACSASMHPQSIRGRARTFPFITCSSRKMPRSSRISICGE